MFKRIISKEPFANFKKMEKKYNKNLESSPRPNYIKLKKEEENFNMFKQKMDDFKHQSDLLLPDINNHRRTTNEEMEHNNRRTTNEDMEYNDFDNVESEQKENMN